tara:strand:+ start:1357 stop:2286 length:930 start_codon:yes stop_codon:yes gene_type:complete
MDKTRGSLTRYILVAFGISWLFWLPVTFATFDLPSFSNAYVSSWFTDLLQGKANTWAHWLVLLGGVLGPLLGGMAAWHYRAGREGIATIGRYLIDGRLADWKAWLSAVVFPLAYFGIGAAFVSALTGVSFFVEGWPVTFALSLLVGCVLVAGEEIGWRGTQLPMHQEKRSAIVSSLLVGITWAYWHFPLMLMNFKPPETGIDGLPQALAMTLILYPLMAIPVSIMMTTVFNTGRGLILLPIIFHALHNELNASMDIHAPSEAAKAEAGGLAGIVLLVSLWIVAIVVLFIFGRKQLSRRPKITASEMLNS